MTAFPNWPAPHRLCLICHNHVPVEMEVPMANTRGKEQWSSKISLHDGECTEKFQATRVEDRSKLVARLDDHKKEMVTALKRDGSDEDEYWKSQQPKAPNSRVFLHPFMAYTYPREDTAS